MFSLINLAPIFYSHFPWIESCASFPARPLKKDAKVEPSNCNQVILCGFMVNVDTLYIPTLI